METIAIPLKVLMVEDRPSDAELVVHVLRHAGFAPEAVRVDTEAAYLAQLDKGWDVILADYAMPQFSATRALELIQQRGLDIPFLVVSGSISEDVAVECMHRGAADYLLKDRLTRLGPAVRRALAAHQSRRQQREAEEQLRQAQKMEGIGRLAGGIAHDFNNLLTIISGYTEMMLNGVGPASDMAAKLQAVQAAADRARDLTRQILAFSRKQLLETRVLNLNTEVCSFDAMLRRLIGEDIEVTTRLAGDLGSVKADSSQIQQVLLNLAVNARDAMPQGGKLIIETANISVDAIAESEHPGLPPGDHVVLAMGDSGCGMNEHTMSHLFEPFFTTKPAGKGTGLGLATVFGIVKQHGGHIEASSKVGLGTTFRIYLPRVEGAPAVAIPAQSGPPATRRGHGSILVVEDFAALRDMVVRIAAGHGYRVLQAQDAAEAEQIAAGHAGPIDLLLSDVLLPGMRGTELYRRLCAARPELKVLFMSGYTSEQAADDGQPLPPGCFLQKPFKNQDLIRRIAESLDTPTQQ